VNAFGIGFLRLFVALGTLDSREIDDMRKHFDPPVAVDAVEVPVNRIPETHRIDKSGGRNLVVVSLDKTLDAVALEAVIGLLRRETPRAESDEQEYKQNPHHEFLPLWFLL